MTATYTVTIDGNPESALSCMNAYVVCIAVKAGCTHVYTAVQPTHYHMGVEGLVNRHCVLPRASISNAS